MLATWAVGDQVFIGIMGGEAASPRFSMAHATKLVPFRVNVVYMLGVIFTTLLVPSDDSRLLGGKGVAASPFVIAVQDSGIPGIPSLLNVGMMIGVLGIAAESIYLSSRILRTMAHQRLISERLAKVDDKGRPRIALLITCTCGLIVAYIQLAGKVRPVSENLVICLEALTCLPPNSRRSCGLELVDIHHQCLLLLQLDHRLLYQLAIPQGC